jgi:DNA-binding transcriptional MerR regulator
MDNLLPINQIAKLTGTNKIHLAYMTKLRLIPQTIRRKVNGKITGCYPESVIKQLRQIEELKSKGLTYSQIKYELESDCHPELVSGPLSLSENPFRHAPEMLKQVQHDNYPVIPNFALAFLIVGLILGYLLAGFNSFNMNTSPLQLAAAKAVTLPAESDYQKVLRLTGNQSSDTQPIYVIAAPSQNIDRLGKVNFNELIK